MERHRLNWQRKGDVLLGTLLEYKKARPDKAVILLTGDNGLALRARSLEIEVTEPPDRHILVEGDYTLAEEKQNLRRELAGFRYRSPDLSLSFSGGKDELAVTTAPQLDSLTAKMQAQLMVVADRIHREAAQRQADDEFVATLDDPDTMAALVAQALPAGDRFFLSGMAEGEAQRYQREVEAYPEKYERYLHRCLQMINVHRRSIRLDLEMENLGGASAEHVLVILTLPEQLEWHWRPSGGDMPAPPTPPTTPKLESQAVERSVHIGRVSLVPSDLLDRDYISDETSAGGLPVISEGGTQIRWELGTYRHHQTRLLEPLYARFRHADDISDFAIACEIQERNGTGLVREWLLVLLDTAVSAGKVES